MFLLHMRDGAFFKRASKPTSKSPVWTIDCDVEPSPMISASGIRGCFISGHCIEYDGEPPVKRDTRSDLPLGPTKPPYRVPLMSEVRAMRWNGLTVVSTFAGAGGSSTGYRMAGYRVALANEFVPIAQESYRANADPRTIVDGRSIMEVTAEEVLEAIGLEPGELDVLDGSPPCQAFSTAGKREKGWGTEREYEHAAQKNEELFSEYIRLLRGLKPKVFVAENVTGLVKGAAKGMFLDILRELKASGYAVEARKLDAQWLGVPQCRERIIFVGVRQDLADAGFKPAFPEPLPYRYSVREALPHLGGGTMSNGHSFSDRALELDGPAHTVLGNDRGGSYRNHKVEPRVVHDTRGSFQSGGHLNERPAPTIMSSAFDAHHFQVHGSDTMLVDAASVTHDDGRPGNRAKDVLNRPSPTIVGSEGKQSNHFSVRQNSNATHSRKGESRSADEPAPTLLARRANLEVQLLTNDSYQEKLISADNPSPTIMAGGPGKTSGYVIERGLSIEGQAIGEEYDRLNPGQQSDKYFSLVRADPARPSPTLTAAGGQNAGIATVVHPTEKRKFSIPEVRRLCGFPDDFVLVGTYGQQWERLGNSVPPVMMAHIAAAIRDKILLPARKLGIGGAKRSGPARPPKGRSTSARPRKGGGKGRPRADAPQEATGRPGSGGPARRPSTPRRPKGRAGGPGAAPG